jgi:fatty-acyl-CoA synthase
MSDLGARIVHFYGLTETYGPYTVCEIQDAWARLDLQGRSRMMTRQGVGMIITDGVRVVAKGIRVLSNPLATRRHEKQPIKHRHQYQRFLAALASPE